MTRIDSVLSLQSISVLGCGTVVVTLVVNLLVVVAVVVVVVVVFIVVVCSAIQ